ncbi:DUF262 domain-containing HNH endonuclease family protein [Nannocystis sp. ILAH1]|uniref:DUF262 domain-containing protein n=1 Tax=unclassified Nannocystis TaxID=2627009 RepID=UPI00226D9E5E|nr:MULTISPECIES: DUF262 domain-containing HNH endonuclease family protein [unclassified Nannocystis]MCY0989025.1 DUF262 domain-containing HNH endonuclease family protein [Nannocystis sp. ILAH1]MCY1068038.1 DUF262 domain-containing HNH endonuclease family protein [Nannocystis sp. RBIL2]
MKTDTAKIHQLFSMERRFVIPLFQRPYVWGPDQWEALWEDIREMTEGIREPNSSSRPAHFLGAIVLQGVPLSGHHVAEFQVIDGQQRLTTLQLFLSALRAAALALKALKVPEMALSLFQNRDMLVNEDVERWKVWPTRKDQDQYLKAMNAVDRAALAAEFPERDPKDRRRKLPRPPMVAAWIYFHDAIVAWANSASESDQTVADRVLDVLLALRTRLEMVQIDLTENESPQVIFETLNARGVPLLAADLLRNYIFQRAGSPAKAEQLHQSYWRRFEVDLDPQNPALGRWWDQEERQGRMTRARLDLFLQHYVTAQTSRVVRIPDLFDDYKAWVKRGSFESVEEELKTLTRYAGHFETLLRADESKPVGRFAERVRAMDQSTVFPLVLWVLDTPTLTDHDRLAILRDLESLLLRRMVCGRPTNGYNKLFLQLLTGFRAQPAGNAAAFHTLLATGKTDVSEWPDDAAFEKAWMDLDAYTELGPGRVVMILRALEDALHGPKTEQVVVQGPLSIEHVMPQAWDPHWPLPGAADTVTEAVARTALLHDFGNLTLITPKFNSSLSNRPANEKLPDIDRHSGLLLNKDFGGGRTTWTEKDIRERTQRLFQLAKRVWPGP